MRKPLTPREETVLWGLVARFLETKSPVGSKFLAQQNPEKLSPATIRAILARLQRMGYLSQGHLSAGREPTDLAYRHFIQSVVRHLRDEPRADMREADRLASGGSLHSVIQGAVDRLARATHTLSFALKPALDEIRLRVCELVRISDDRILLIVVSQGGDLHEKVIPCTRKTEPGFLRECANYLNDTFHGQRFESIRTRIRRELDRSRSLDGTAPAALRLVAPYFLAEPHPREICVEGFDRMLHPDGSGAPMGSVRSVLLELEKKSLLLDLLDSVSRDERRVRVMLGEDLPVPGAADLSMVVASYSSADARPGLVGVLGPISMRYDQTIPIVFHTARTVTLAGSRL